MFSQFFESSNEYDKDYKTGEVLGDWFGPDPQVPEFTYLKGDITEAYSSKAREVKRSFVFLNFGGGQVPAALIVFDKVVSSKAAFKKYWILHSMEEPAVQDNSVVVTLTQRGWSGKMVNTTLLPEAGNARIAKVGGPGKKFWVFGKDFPNEIRKGQNPSYYEIGAWRVELSPGEAATTDYFLNAMQVMDTDGGKPAAVEKLESGDVVGVRLADRIVLFNRKAERTDRPVTFSVNAGGTFKCLVTDLAAGTWQLWRDGRILNPAMPVSAEAGTLYFQGPSGHYSLRR